MIRRRWKLGREEKREFSLIINNSQKASKHYKERSGS